MVLRVLQICPKVPYPPIDGGCIASNNVTKGLLKRGHRVKVLSLNNPKHPADMALANETYVRETDFETLFMDNTLNPRDALKSYISNSCYTIDRFYSRAFEDLIVSRIREEPFDIIHFETAYTASYLPAVRRATAAVAVFRAHNIEYEIWQGTRALERNAFKRAYFGVLARQMEVFERSILNKFDGIAAITAQDGRRLSEMGCRVPIETIPFGVDLSSVRSETPMEFPTVFHLGSMDWLPNQEGIRWFLDEVWPQIIARFPETILYLAGRSMPDWLTRQNRPSVKVLGEVENAHDFMASKAVMVVPLFSGSGMRIKIVEGLALEKCIVSTTLGATGIDYEDGTHLLIADTAEAFVDKLSLLLADRTLLERIGRNAADLAWGHYDNDVIAKKLEGFYHRLLKQGP